MGELHEVGLSLVHLYLQLLTETLANGSYSLNSCPRSK